MDWDAISPGFYVVLGSVLSLASGIGTELFRERRADRRERAASVAAAVAQAQDLLAELDGSATALRRAEARLRTGRYESSVTLAQVLDLDVARLVASTATRLTATAPHLGDAVAVGLAVNCGAAYHEALRVEYDSVPHEAIDAALVAGADLHNQLLYAHEGAPNRLSQHADTESGARER